MDREQLEALGFSAEEGYTCCPVSAAESLPATLLSVTVLTGIRSGADLRRAAAYLLRRFAPESEVCLWEEGQHLQKSLPVGALAGEDTGSGAWCVIFDPKACLRASAGAFSLDRIIQVMAALRGSHGCPWDRAQDHETLRTYLIQEAYEVVDAIDHQDMENLKEELGDVLFQVVFHSRLAEEAGLFTMQDVVDGIADKMVDRHPYVFGTMTAEETAELLGSWEVRKLREKKRSHLLSGLSVSLPSLLFACIMQKKVSSICKETGTLEDVRCHFESSWRKAMALAETGGAKDDMERCLGEALFDAVRIARFCGVDPELALHRFNRLYAEKLGALEDTLREGGQAVIDLTQDSLKAMEASIRISKETSGSGENSQGIPE